MLQYTIGFTPPMVGLDGYFNTIRLGGAMMKRLKVGDTVYLMNEKDKSIFGEAEVLSLEAGGLGELCLVHAHANHTEVGRLDGNAAQRLFALLQKLHGPHIATPERRSCVIYLRRKQDATTGNDGGCSPIR